MGISRVKRTAISATMTALVALVVAAAETDAALVTTSTSSAGDWDDPNTWNGGVVPNSTFNTEYQVTIGHDVDLVNPPAISLARLAIESGKTMTIELSSITALLLGDGRFLNGLQNENLINDGTLQINLGGLDSNVEAGIFTPPHYLNRSGAVIHLNATGPPGFAVFAFEGPFHNQSGATIMLSDQPVPQGVTGGNVLFGSSTFLGDRARLTNDGLITGAGDLRSIFQLTNTSMGTISTSTNNPLIISGGSHVNQGIMQATGPGGFILIARLESSGTMEIDNSKLELRFGAELTTTGGATVDFSGTSELIFEGNQSAFDINNTGNLTVIDNSPVSQITGSATNQGGGTLTVQNSLSLDGTMTNHGSFTLAANQILTTDDFENDGGVVLDTLSTAIINAGHKYNQTGGSTDLMDATIDASAAGSSIDVSAGSINGTGALNGPVNVSGTGTIAPGLSFGQVTIDGDLAVADDGMLLMELGEMDMVATSDFLSVSGQTSFNGGKIAIELVDGFLPETGFVHPFFDFQGGVIGTPEISVIGGSLTGDLDPVTGQIMFTLASLLGDANNDNQVSGQDLISVQQNFGNDYANGVCDGQGLGDANDDCLVTGLDLISVQQNFGKALTASAPPVPEPATVSILFGLSMYHRRRHRAT